MNIHVVSFCANNNMRGFCIEKSKALLSFLINNLYLSCCSGPKSWLVGSLFMCKWSWALWNCFDNTWIAFSDLNDIDHSRWDAFVFKPKILEYQDDACHRDANKNHNEYSANVCNRNTVLLVFNFWTLQLLMPPRFFQFLHVSLVQHS